MLFYFLKYLQPTNYFSLYRHDQFTVFPKIEGLPSTISNQLQVDENYTSKLAQTYDLSWQALHKGHIDNALKIKKIEPIPLIDEYVFIRKYFHKVWVFYVLLIRLFSFKNPFREILLWYKTRRVKRSDYLKKPITYEHWESFESQLIDEYPKVSIIIPTLNRYDYLKDVLGNLEKQDYKNFNVHIVDQSEPFNKAFYNEFQLNLKVSYQKEKALWLARNNAIRQCESDYILLFDDDSLVTSDWISNHLKCVDFFNADISSGVSISKTGAKVPEHYSFFRESDQLDTGNVLIKKSVFKQIGLFDRQFEKQRMGDGEFGLRAFLNGFLNVSNPYSKRVHLKVSSGGLREMGSWDAFRTKRWFAPRPIPSVLYFFRKYFGSSASKFALMRTVPLSIMPYAFKKNKFMLALGVFVSLLILPIVLFQVYKSWQLSSKKLNQGALIESLH